MRGLLAIVLAIAGLLAGCIDPVAARWELEHDQVIAVRATPPGLAPGEQATLDALVARGGRAVIEVPASVQAPGSDLEGMVSFDGAAWIVTAPSEARLAALRPGLGLGPGDPVPVNLLVELAFGDGRRHAKKTIWLGARGANPALPEITIDGRAAGAILELPIERDVYVEAAADPDHRVNWLTSCGTLFQDDVARAFVHVDEPDAGELAVVIRDRSGGVTWAVWPVVAR
jgi:hypothetical protein